MKAERWRRVEALFVATVELPEPRRSAYLAERCGDDPELRREVLELLAMDETGEGEVLNDVVQAEARAVVQGSEASLTGRRIGPWLVQDQIGHGGMSTVYLAERADQQFRKQVAFKVLKRGMDTDEILHRFHNERQILASLDHPQIARLIDAGSTSEGLPYFVMDHVAGTHIDAYCDAQHLRLGERLALFRSVCEAVAYAHRNLVVHRDLKPSNILATDSGDIKLLDFGIAKLLNSELLGEGFEPTIGPMRMMTPSYASPELVAGRAVTTASDVYSLGVLLYLLLSGLRPLDLTGNSTSEIERRLLEEQPEPPSVALKRCAGDNPSQAAEAADCRGTDLKHLVRQLDGDLDTLVLKTLRKEPERRYASVEHLMDDLDRFVTGRPLAARRESFGYVAGKLLRRHRLAAVGIASLVLLVTAFVTALLLQSIKLKQQRGVAEREQAAAEEATEFLMEIFEVAEPDQAKGEVVSAIEVLEQGSLRAHLKLADKPEMQAKVFHTLGEVFEKLGRYEQAEPLLMQALRLRRQVFGPVHHEVATSLNRLAVLRSEQGKLMQSERLFRQVLMIRQELYGREHIEVAASLNNLALLLHEKGDLEDAAKLYQESLDLEDRVGTSETKLSTLSNLAFLLLDLQDFEKAEAIYRRVLAATRATHGSRYPEVARLMTELGMTLRELKRFDEARVQLSEAVAVRREVLGPDHPHLALSLRQLAALETDRGACDLGLELHQEALDIRRRSGVKQAIADSLAGMAESVACSGEPLKAESMLREALVLHREGAFPPAHPATADVLVALAQSVCSRGESQNASDLLVEALEILGGKLPTGDRRIVEAEALQRACTSPEIS